MKFAIFYFTQKRIADLKYNPILLEGGKWMYIRVEEVEAADDLAALDKAKPRRGESLMNAHEIK